MESLKMPIGVEGEDYAGSEFIFPDWQTVASTTQNTGKDLARLLWRAETIMFEPPNVSWSVNQIIIENPM